ncbi:hypothetical protein CEQ90_18835 [Lewinellaceae bacterium SD302]|nr:hypothetical protein CEQ90_18835 [Lewinellaceae bacterium SD302]
MKSQPVALVTGASSGLGEALAPLLAQKGYKVYGMSRREVALPGVTSLSCDVADKVAVEAAIRELTLQSGRLDLVMHCAGIGGGGPVEHMPLERARKIMDVNFWGTYMLCQECLPHLIAAPKGRLLIVGSIGGFMGIPFRAAYCASKGALQNLVESLRLETADTNLQVSLVTPGDMATNSFATQYRVPHEEVHERYRRRYVSADNGMRDHVGDGMAAGEVAQKMIDIAEKKSLNPQYIIGEFTQKISPIARRILPGKWWEKLLGSYYK